MKVKLAAQVFSNTVYSVLCLLNKHVIPENSGTKELLLFINDLFDSLNSKFRDNRPYARRVRIDSIHHKFWGEAKLKLGSVRFVQVREPPCLKFLLKTIENVQNLWFRLKNLGFNYLLTSNLNQDPLENFFSVIRGLCDSNTNPTCAQFVSAFKTSLIKNTLKNSKASNCTDDGGNYLLAISSLLSKSEITTTPNIPVTSSISFLSPVQQTSVEDLGGSIKLKNSSSAYIAGYIGRRVLDREGETCTNFYTTNKITDSHAYIKLKDYGTADKPKLVYLSEEKLMNSDLYCMKICQE